jgi:hypothetical protein
MSTTYESINELSELQYALERARIILSIEMELTQSTRNSTQYKYWTNVNGIRYLQVLETNDQHFKKDTKEKFQKVFDKEQEQLQLLQQQNETATQDMEAAAAAVEPQVKAEKSSD